MNHSKVTVVTPSLNQGKYIERTILSVLSQDYQNLEYIVVDGGSSDDTLTILKRYNDRLRWISEPDSGQSEAINKGWKMASGEILAYLNSDDTYKPGAVSYAVKYLSEDPELLMVYSDVDLVDEADRLIRFLPGEEWDLKRLISDPIYFIPQQGVVFRARVLDTIGFLDESLHFKMDRDFYIRIGMHGGVKRMPCCLANGRIHSEAKQHPRNAADIWRESVLLRRRYGARVSWRGYLQHYLSLGKQRYLIDPCMKVPVARRLIGSLRARNIRKELQESREVTR